MSSEDRDPLLDQLQTLPVHTLASRRSEEALRLAEQSLPAKVRPGQRWPAVAMAFVLASAGMLYTVESVHKLESIYLSNHAPANVER
jgi:hypothetical protein